MTPTIQPSTRLNQLECSIHIQKWRALCENIAIDYKLSVLPASDNSAKRLVLEFLEANFAPMILKCRLLGI